MKKFIPIVFSILAFFFYQSATKGVPADMNVFVNLMVSYVVIIVLGIAGFFVLPQPEGVEKSLSQVGREFKGVVLSGAILGVWCVGLDLGNIFAYVVGWDISVAPLFQVGLGTVLLVLIARFIYKEDLGARKLLGIVAVLGGLIMISLG